MDANEILAREGAKHLAERIDKAMIPARPETAPVPKVAGSGVRLLRPSEFRQQHAPRADDIVSGLFRARTMVSVNARPGVGKTALLVELARALSEGTPFLGRNVQAIPVAYLACEDAAGVADRLDAAKSSNVLMVDSDSGFLLTNVNAARATIETVIAQLRSHSGASDKPVGVMIDTLRAALGDSSVLDDRVTAPGLNMLRAVAEKHNAVFFIANHTNRENPRATKGETLESVVTTELLLASESDGWIRIDTGKHRFGIGNRPIGRMKIGEGKADERSVGVVVETECITGAVGAEKMKRLSDEQQRVLDIFERLKKDGKANVLELRDGYVAERKYTARNSSMRTFNNALDALVRAGHLNRGTDTENEDVIWEGHTIE